MTGMVMGTDQDISDLATGRGVRMSTLQRTKMTQLGVKTVVLGDAVGGVGWASDNLIGYGE